MLDEHVTGYAAIFGGKIWKTMIYFSLIGKFYIYLLPLRFSGSKSSLIILDLMSDDHVTLYAANFDEKTCNTLIYL